MVNWTKDDSVSGPERKKEGTPMKKLLSLVIVLALLMTAALSEGNPAEEDTAVLDPAAGIEGIWVLQYLETDDETDVQTAQFNAMLAAGMMVYVYTFKDGVLSTYVMVGGELVDDMYGSTPYRIDGNRIVFIQETDPPTESDEGIEFILDGNTLKLLIQSSVGVFKRVEQTQAE